MSAIAYITDSKMLEFHRLSSHDTMNFWRPSANISFSDFGVDDLVFFLSKDKEHRKGNEKGVVGFGRVRSMMAASVRSTWKRYGELNGYRDLDDFKEAILKITKEEKVPEKISSFYLENVCFFQPVYLSECGIQISRNVESYIYLKPEDKVVALLEVAKNNGDLWTGFAENVRKIEQEEALYALFQAHSRIGDIPLSDSRKAENAMKRYQKSNDSYSFVQGSKNELYRCGENGLEVLFYYDKSIDQRLLLGQACLYNLYIKRYEEMKYPIRFIGIDKEGRKKSLFQE